MQKQIANFVLRLHFVILFLHFVLQNQIRSRIEKVPSQERGFRDISRQQQIVEALYLFLLQKREENEIKAAATPENIKVIDFAYDSKIPVSPKKNIVLLGAIILGIIVPFAFIYIYKLLNNNVNSKEDVDYLIEKLVKTVEKLRN